MHGNARSSPLGRLGMVLRVIEEGEPVARVARGMGLSRQCVSKWVRRYREEGEAGLEDRSSRPRCSPMRTSPEVEELVLRARRRLRAGPARLSAFTGVPERTISRILRRHGDVASVGMRPADPANRSKPLPGRWCGMNGNGLVSCCIWTLRSFLPYPPAGDGRYTAGATPPPAERDGPLCTPSWTTTPASPTPKRYQTRKEPPSPRSPPAPSTTSTN